MSFNNYKYNTTISKKYINLGFEVHLSENYGEHLGFKNDEFKAQGVKILSDEKKILDHGVEVAKELAHVLSGGDTTIDKTLSEDDLFKLELDAFMKLIETQKTQDRIKHTLSTGKPLVN